MAEHGSFGSVCWNCSEQMTQLYFNKACGYQNKGVEETVKYDKTIEPGYLAVYRPQENCLFFCV